MLNNCFDLGERNRKGRGDLFLRNLSGNIHGPHLPNDVPRHGSPSVVLSGMVADIHSSFPNHIVGVLLKGSKEQMVRIGAWRIIAFVKNIHSFWNWSKVEYPRNTMGTNMPLSSITPSHTWIIPFAGFFPSRPLPAWTEFWSMFWNWTVFIYLCPKSFRGGWRKSLLCEILGGNNVIHSSIGGSGFVFRHPGPLSFKEPNPA